jgi:aspartyl-tRNA(Asn)/glutamyl-tRNA(Gln) amidotransferase subunit B
MRGKEEAHDYRYFPEPDLPPLDVEPGWIDEVRATLPETPEARRRRFIEQYALPEYDAALLTQSSALADFYEATAAASGNPKGASNWIMGALTSALNERGAGIEASAVTPSALAGLIRLVDSGTISGPIAKRVFDDMYASGRSADDIVRAEGLGRIDDESAIGATIREVLAAHGPAVAQYRAGKRQTFGFLVGQVIKATGGRANPALVNRLVTQALEGDAQ